MSATNLVRTESVDGVLLAVLTTGSLSDYESGLVVGQIQKEAPNAHWRIVADFGEVQFMSSPGISLILTLVQDAKAHKGRLIICHLHEDIHDILRMTKVDKMITIVPTRDDAMKKMG